MSSYSYSYLFTIGSGKMVFCAEHKTEVLKSFCKSCDIPLCIECESTHKVMIF